MTTMEGAGEVTGEKTRIYVGGLGGGVTEDDLRKTFSALGEVVAVDVVRTKGRSFAYLDFLPSSDKSLPKLFSTYNGCMWKGGKLRLEKAKEHYLLRLKREWQEESASSSKASHNRNTDPSESQDTLEKPKKLSPSEKTQLCLFFPKLGKVKSLAQVGIGKHKYSFQRIPVPSIPTHFCDCEEHSDAFIPTKKKQSFETENASDGINEQELEIMNSVMNKIFERANPCKEGTGKSELLNGMGVSMNSVNELAAVEDDEEDHLTDEDNLIINVATGSDTMDMLGEMRTMMAKQEPVAKRLITSGEKPKSMDSTRKKKTTLLSKKRKSLHTEENDGNDSIIPETSRNSNICLDSREGNKTGESGTKQSGSNSLRSLKSTWKDLIGQKGNTPFSISDIIASVPQEKEKDNLVVRNKKRKSEGDKTKNKLAASFPETKLSKLHLNKKPTTESGAVTAEISTADVLANDSQRKGEEPRADLDVPLATTSQKTNESDVLPEGDKTKNKLAASFPETKLHLNKEPTTESGTVTVVISTADVLANDSQRKGEEPRADLDVPLATTFQKPDESDVLPDASEQNEEPRTEELVTSHVENEDNNQSGNSKDPAKHDEDYIRAARGESWRHKSSWTQLISTASHTSFSISHIVPDISSENHKQQADTFDSQPTNKDLNTSADAPINNQIPAGVTEATMKNKNTSEHKKILSLASLGSEDTCPFMRTEESMKEWKKAKASLSGSLNKKKRSVKEPA